LLCLVRRVRQGIVETLFSLVTAHANGQTYLKACGNIYRYSDKQFHQILVGPFFVGSFDPSPSVD